MSTIQQLYAFRRWLLPHAFNMPAHADKYVTVFSHPRSGTHFLETFLGKNFYPGEDLKQAGGAWGHWADRKPQADTFEFGKLFGSHQFPNKKVIELNIPKIYIVRDPRAVALSVWKTPNFLHPDLDGISFSDMLRVKLDWIGSPSWRYKPVFTIGEHWVAHVNGWLEIAKKDPRCLILSYDQLVNKPYDAYLKIHSTFFTDQTVLAEHAVDFIKKPVGLLPNAANTVSWKQAFSQEDEEFLFSQVPNSMHRFLSS